MCMHRHQPSFQRCSAPSNAPEGKHSRCRTRPHVIIITDTLGTWQIDHPSSARWPPAAHKMEGAPHAFLSDGAKVLFSQP